MNESKIPDNFAIEPSAVVSACAAALRKWTVSTAGLVGMTEARTLLFAEALSAGQAELTTEELAALLQEMARRVSSGGLGPSSIQ